MIKAIHGEEAMKYEHFKEQLLEMSVEIGLALDEKLSENERRKADCAMVIESFNT